MSSALTSPPSCKRGQFVRRQHRLELRRRLAGLRRMRFVGDDREPLALRRGLFVDRFEREGERLDRANDDLLALRQRGGELTALAAAVALDGDDDALRAFERRERVLQLPVDHIAVGHDDDRREELLVLGVVKVGEEMRRPGDRIGFARSGRMLNEIFAARAFLAHRRDQLSRGVELVIAREDEFRDLPLLVLLGDDVAAEDFEP